jgi:hypothetical protein
MAVRVILTPTPTRSQVYPCAVEDIQLALNAFPAADLEALCWIRFTPAGKRNGANARYFLRAQVRHPGRTEAEQFAEAYAILKRSSPLRKELPLVMAPPATCAERSVVPVRHQEATDE